MEKTLLDCELNKTYKIKKIEIEDKLLYNQLNNIGICEESNIKIFTKNYNDKTYLINVYEINYGLSKNICEKIIVYDN